MKIKVTDSNIQRLRDEANTARGVLNNMNLSGMTAADDAYRNAVKPAAEKIAVEIHKAQEGARVRCHLLEADALADKACAAERHLDDLEIPQGKRRGCELVLSTGEGEMPNTLKYEWAYSQIILQRGAANGAWYFTGAWRKSISAFGRGEYRSGLYLSEAAIDHITDKCRKNHSMGLKPDWWVPTYGVAA